MVLVLLEPKKEAKETYIKLRVSTEEKEWIKSLAKKENLTVTDLIKISINQYADRDN